MWSPRELQAKGPMIHVAQTRAGSLADGSTKVNQDRYVIKYAVNNDPGISMWGVMDGHGEFGQYVAAFIQEYLPICLAQEAPQLLRQEPEAALTRTVSTLCRRLKESNIDCSMSGSTLVFGVRIDAVLYVSNVGDSACVLAQMDAQGKVQTLSLTVDHKPDRPDEQARIIANGGRVQPLPGAPDDCGPARVWLAKHDYPGLAMSRSIGDDVAQTVGVISIPEVTRHVLSSTLDLWLIWASDGVWEFVTHANAVDILWQNRYNLDEGVRKLIEESTRRWNNEESVVDDITCVAVQLRPPN